MPILDDQSTKTVFILSTGRTGTKAIAQIMENAFESVVGLHEPKPAWRFRIASCAYLSHRRTRGQMAKLLAKARRRSRFDVNHQVRVESNPYLFGFLEVLGDVFDHPRVVHVTRDPRTMVRSALNFGVQKKLKLFLSDNLPYWMIKPESVEPGAPRIWREMTPVERFAWFWRVVNSHLNQGETIYGGDYRRVRYEDLFRTDGDEFRRLCNWIGVVERKGKLETALSTRVNASTGEYIPDWHAWPQPDQQALLDHCGPLMPQYGYD